MYSDIYQYLYSSQILLCVCLSPDIVCKMNCYFLTCLGLELGPSVGQTCVKELWLTLQQYLVHNLSQQVYWNMNIGYE